MENKLVVTNGEREVGRGKIGVEDSEAQRCKIVNKRWRKFYSPEYGTQRRLVGWLILGAEVCVRILAIIKSSWRLSHPSTL